MSSYEISPREREDEQRRWRDEFDAPEETYWAYLDRCTARLPERPKAGEEGGSSSMTAPGTGRSESREEAA